MDISPYNENSHGIYVYNKVLFSNINIYLNLFINPMSNLKQIENIDKKKYPHIVVSPDTYKKLKSMGRMGESFDDVITKILAKQVGVYEVDV